jgi:hypothetical protein
VIYLPTYKNHTTPKPVTIGGEKHMTEYIVTKTNRPPTQRTDTETTEKKQNNKEHKQETGSAKCRRSQHPAKT